MSDFDWVFDDTPLNSDKSLNAPTKLELKRREREYIIDLQKKSLTELIPTLPPPDNDIYLITNGSGGTFKGTQANAIAFEFGHFVPQLQTMLGVSECYISTWTMNRYHAQSLLDMVADKRLSKLTVFTDPYFTTRESAVANMLMEGMITHGQRFLTFKNHCKILAMHGENGYCTVLSSANLSAQPRTENYVLNTDPKCYEWVVEGFFNAMLERVKDG